MLRAYKEKQAAPVAISHRGRGGFSVYLAKENNGLRNYDQLIHLFLAAKVRPFHLTYNPYY